MPWVGDPAAQVTHTFFAGSSRALTTAVDDWLENLFACRKLPSYVPYKGTYVPYNGTFGVPDQGQTLDM